MANITVNVHVKDSDNPEMMELSDGDYALLIDRVTVFMTLDQVSALRQVCANTVDEFHYKELESLDNDPYGFLHESWDHEISPLD